MSWASNEETLNEVATRLTYAGADGSRLTWAGLIEAWKDANFADLFSDSIARHPSKAVRWESPCLTRASLNKHCEFVLVSSPGLDRSPNKAPFEDQLADDPLTTTFTNLGGDATLIVPGETDTGTNYVHLASFLRTATTEQRRALWLAAADALNARLSDQPVWLSTAGGGVAWLHLRLDDTPKYYSHGPYRDLHPRT